MTSIRASLKKNAGTVRFSPDSLIFMLPFAACCFIEDAAYRSCIMISMLCALAYRRQGLFFASMIVSAAATAIFHLENLPLLLIVLAFLNLLLQGIALTHLNRFTSLPYVAAICVSIEMMLRLADFRQVFTAALSVGFCTFFLDDPSAQDKDLLKKWLILVGFACSMFFLPDADLALIWFTAACYLAVFVLDIRTLICFLGISTVFGLRETGVYVAFSASLISCIPQKQGALRLAVFSALLVLGKADWLCAFQIAAAVGITILIERVYPLSHKTEMVSLSLDRQTSDCAFQLQQFSKIFELLAAHYKSTPFETELINSMGKTLLSMSLQIKSSSQSKNALHRKIMQTLHGYRFEILRLTIDEKDDGGIFLRLHLASCSRQEVMEMVVPLLEKCVHKKLKIFSLSKSKAMSGFVALECGSEERYKLHVHAYCCSKETVSGDQYSTFECKDQTCVILSDGMGSGPDAKEESDFLIELAQRMIASNMPLSLVAGNINECMTLTGKEKFATLDFLCFDRNTKEAYLIKSGSCPTYLIRNKCVIEIKGEGLPLGIIQKIKPDCFRITCRTGDTFVMVSDGIESYMLEKWFQDDKGKLEEKIKSAMKKSNKQFKDDATILLAQVRPV